MSTKPDTGTAARRTPARAGVPVPAQRTRTRSPFLASSDGFVFHNSWPSQPAVVFKTPFGKVDIGNAKGGLCGGMVFAALDYWHADRRHRPNSPRRRLRSTSSW